MDELVSWDDVVVWLWVREWGAWHLTTPCWVPFLVSGQWLLQGWFCWLLLALCSFLLSCAGPDARHPGRYGSEGHFCSEVVAVLAFLLVLQFALCSLRCRQVCRQVVTGYGWFWWCRRTLRYVPFFCSQAQMLASWQVLTRRTVALCIPVPVYWCVDFPCRGAEAYSHGLLFRRPLRFSCCSSTRCSMSLLHTSCRFPYIWQSCTVFGVRLGSTSFGFSGR